MKAKKPLVFLTEIVKIWNHNRVFRNGEEIMDTPIYEKHYKKVIEKIIEEASVPESERAANMLAQLEADVYEKKENARGRSISDKVGRNDPCPCGSGKKYKRCCGR